MRLRERGRGKDAVHMQQRRQCCFYFCIFCAPAKAVSDFVPRIVSSSRLFGLAHRLHRACFDSSPQPLILSFLAFHSYPFLEHITSTIFFLPLCSRIYSNHTWVFGSFSLLDTRFSGKIICETPCAASRSTLIYGTVSAVLLEIRKGLVQSRRPGSGAGDTPLFVRSSAGNLGQGRILPHLYTRLAYVCTVCEESVGSCGTFF